MNRPCHVVIVGSQAMANELMKNPRLNIECIFVMGGGKSDHQKSAAGLHDELYALTPGPDPVDVPLVREKKKKLPWRKRKFCRHY